MKYLIIVEDDADTADYVKACFEDSQLSVTHFNNGSAALNALFQGTKVDAILLDIMMPQMDGLEFLTQIRNDPKLKQIKVIMMTARDQLDDVVRAKELGISGYVRKPFTPEQIINKVMQALGI